MLWLECLMNQVGRKEQGRKAPRGRLCLTMAFLRRSKYPSDWISYFLQPNYSKLGWDIKRKLKEHYVPSGKLITILIASQAATWRRKRWIALANRRLILRFRRNFVSRAKIEVVIYLMNFNQCGGQIRGNVIIIKRPSDPWRGGFIGPEQALGLIKECSWVGSSD